MSLRKSLREKRVPVRYGECEENSITQQQKSNKQISTKTSTSSQRLILQAEIEKIEELNRLEKEFETKELERQRNQEAKELERQRAQEAKELERQRAQEAKELERQKRLLEARTALKSMSVCGSQDLQSRAASTCNSGDFNSKVGSTDDFEKEEETQCKVERWLYEKEPSVQMSSSAIMTTAVQKLADSFRNAIKPVSFRHQLPTFSGQPDEWPMFFAEYEKTVKSFSEEENLTRLRNCLEGDAFKMVKPLFVSSKNVSTIIKTLQMRFGRPEFIIESMLKKTKTLPPVKEDDVTSLIEFSTNILNFTTTAHSLHMEHYMTNPQLLSELLCKLPYSLKYNWAQHISNLSMNRPNLTGFSEWLEKQCSMMSIYFQPPGDNVTRKKNEVTHVFTNAPKESNLCMFCPGKHESERCPIFRKADISQRWKMVAENKLCFFCFRRHQLRTCKTKRYCGINGCKLFHHRCLHNDKREKRPQEKLPYPAKELESCDTKEIITNHTMNGTSNRVLLRICPVTLYGPKGQFDTYALLDDGSTVSLIDSSVADKLGLNGKAEPLTTCWSNSTRHFDPSSRKLNMQIKGFYEEEMFTLSNVRTQSPLDLPRQEVDSVKLKNKWTHLSSINQPLPNTLSKPTILIGQDNCKLILTRKIVEGPTNAPVLSWSYLGWTVHGKNAQCKDRVDEDFTLLSFERDDSLHDMVKESFKIEEYGGEASGDEIKVKSLEDEQALTILEKTTNKIGNHYEAGLLWKSYDFRFPPSFENALRRLKSIEKKMEKDSTLKANYIAKITEYVDKGYVRKLSREEAALVSDRTFYLPHFGVVNPNKPNKMRLVFDAAAKSHGVSFNDALLSGPDILNPLPSVLLKFRLGKFAIVGDIKEMFHQIRIIKEDVDSQRFLWRNGDSTREPDTYVMEAMTFGSTCSPSTALFVVNKNARQFMSIYPEASNSILKKEYMDDLIDSLNTEEEARRRVHEIIEIHKAGGFEICNWLSNSKKVLMDIPENLKANSTKQLKPETNLPTERVLGMWWDAESDKFVFHQSYAKLKLMDTDYPTKREVLKAAMSIFDPLGLITPTTIKGRLLVQDIWRTKTGWDEVVATDLCIKWKKWLDEVNSLQIFKVQRCYFNTSDFSEIELHVFVDASEEAFAATAYFRLKMDKVFKTMLVMARAKVAPLKPVSIPRLELQAAVFGCKIANCIQKDIGFQINRRTFWSDSATVLHWIKTDPRVFKQFVANRVNEIQNLSKTEEWRWIPSKQNPADIATRSKKKFSAKLQDEWVSGPTFLCLEVSSWPTQPLTLQIKDDKEVKRQFIGIHVQKISCFIEVNKFSSWEKLTRTLAWVLRFVKIVKERTKSRLKKRPVTKSIIDYNSIEELTNEEMKIAEQEILKLSQDECFEEEKFLLTSNKALPKSSRIYVLSPFIDENNLIRMSSRICYSPELYYDQKQPIILDGKSHIAYLIAKMFHETCFHQGTETIISKIRQKYWFLNLRSTVKKVKKRCMRCRIDNAKPTPPQMAPLPSIRVTRVEHPFFFTGVDYFGPIEVSIGRRHEKRWGVLFTCLSTRAVHLEVAHSLTTESCVMAIQRFISRRPCPSEMFSDNGTNFVGTDKALRKAIKTLNHAHIQRDVVRHGIQWNFIPPRAPHMGGCWERLVKSVKTALRCVMRSQFPKDEEFMTFLTRVEFILNSRPLTHVSVDPLDPEPLTPNHFIREGFKISLEDNLCKRQLARIRTLLDSFWKRWIHEYLPCLTKRCKWYGKVEPPKVGDLAIIVDEDHPRNTWPLGRVKATYPGRDGQIRIVDIETTRGVFRRPVTKLSILSSEGDRM